MAAAAAAAATGMKTPVPLWKARDILLEAVRGESASFFEDNSALCSKRQRREGGLTDGGVNGTPIASGAGNGYGDDAGGGDTDGEHVEHVFSVRLEVGYTFSSLCAAGGGGGGW